MCSAMEAPRPHTDPDSDYTVCGICPSLRFPRAGFVIYDRPSRECPFNPDDGYRYTAEGTPACVHPHKIGLEPDRIAPAYTPEPPTEPAPTRGSAEIRPKRIAGLLTPPRSRWRWSFRGR